MRSEGLEETRRATLAEMQTGVCVCVCVWEEV